MCLWVWVSEATTGVAPCNLDAEHSWWPVCWILVCMRLEIWCISLQTDVFAQRYALKWCMLLLIKSWMLWALTRCWIVFRCLIKSWMLWALRPFRRRRYTRASRTRWTAHVPTFCCLLPTSGISRDRLCWPTPSTHCLHCTFPLCLYLGGHLGIHLYPLLFSPWKWFLWIPWPQKPRWGHQIHHSKTDADGVILDARVRQPSWTPSWITPLCPTSGMSTQVFFKSTRIKNQN